MGKEKRQSSRLRETFFCPDRPFDQPAERNPVEQGVECLREEEYAQSPVETEPAGERHAAGQHREARDDVVARYGPEVSESGEDAVLRGVQCLADYYDTEDAESSRESRLVEEAGERICRDEKPCGKQRTEDERDSYGVVRQRTYRRTVFLQGVGDVFRGRYSESEGGESGYVEHRCLHDAEFTVGIYSEEVGDYDSGKHQESVAETVAENGPERVFGQPARPYLSPICRCFRVQLSYLVVCEPGFLHVFRVVDVAPVDYERSAHGAFKHRQRRYAELFPFRHEQEGIRVHCRVVHVGSVLHRVAQPALKHSSIATGSKTRTSAPPLFRRSMSARARGLRACVVGLRLEGESPQRHSLPFQRASEVPEQFLKSTSFWAAFTSSTARRTRIS